MKNTHASTKYLTENDREVSKEFFLKNDSQDSPKILREVKGSEEPKTEKSRNFVNFLILKNNAKLKT